MARRWRLVAAALVSVVVGCSAEEGKGTDPSAPKPNPDADQAPGEVPPPPPSKLLELHTCGEVADAIKADARRKVNETVDSQIEQLRQWTEGQFGGATFGSAGGGGDRAESSGASAGSSGSSGTGGASVPAPPPSPVASETSQTNTQVKGVDEADIVKNDGSSIYLLHGNTLQVLTAWPAPSLAASGRVDIEGQPTEMFVAERRAVVFSTVDGSPIYAAAGLTPRTWFEGYGKGAGRSCYDGYSCSRQNPLTKVTLLRIEGTTPIVERELYFEGSYTSSRRIDNDVRVILQGATFGPRLRTYPDMANRANPSAPLTVDEQIASWESLRHESLAAIDATGPESWLPYGFVRTGGSVTAKITACDRFYVPTESTTEHGVTQIASFDLAKAEPAGTVGILGQVDTVYGNDDSLVLAAHAWISPKRMTERPANRKAPFVDYLPSSATYLHAFDIKTNPREPKYLASGAVAGSVLNQFSIDRRGDVIRIATTEQRSVRTWISDDPKVRPFVNQFSVNRVFAVRPKDAELKVVGDVGDLAPGERIYSTRFVGDKGYVVTFRQVDPLFVIDLARPEALKVLGQLKIPGFSEYMHPLDDGHLLTIGRDTEDGRRRGLALQIFDVTQATQPRLMHKYVYDDSTWGSSEAESNHKAFTYFASRNLLSFPFYGYANNGTFKSSAELFRIDLATGITPIGSVDHTSLFGTNYRGYCGGWFSPHVRRSVFFEDVLFSISYGGVIATDTKNLAAPPLSTLRLAAPVVPDYPGCGLPPGG